MNRFHRGAWACTAALLLSSCAVDFGAPINGAEGGASSLSPQESRLQALETRLADLTRRVEGLNLAAQNQQLPQLESELRALRGETESLRHDLQTNEQRSRELYQDLDRRLQALEQGVGSTPKPPATGALSPPPTSASPEEEAVYLQVFEQLKSGRYD
ncbi:MAG: hypothetical protein L0Y32_03370, partial [Nevskiales bacterium]|nr:hypothetical protein [Nevskiales bacterium]